MRVMVAILILIKTILTIVVILREQMINTWFPDRCSNEESAPDSPPQP